MLISHGSLLLEQHTVSLAMAKLPLPDNKLIALITRYTLKFLNALGESPLLGRFYCIFMNKLCQHLKFEIRCHFSAPPEDLSITA